MNKLLDTQISGGQAEEHWRTLDNAFDLIAEKNSKSLSYQVLYSSSYLLVLNRYGNYVYDQLKESFKRIFKMFINKIQSCPRDFIILQLVQVWEDVRYFVRIVSDVFLYMDKTYVFQKNLKTVRTLATEIFRSLLFDENQELFQSLQSALIDEVKRDRDGQVIEKMQLKNALSMLLEIDLIQSIAASQTPQSYPDYVYHLSDKFYKSFFEQKLIRESSKYYGQESMENIKTMSIENFIKIAKSRLEQEIERVRNYMHNSSEKPLKESFLQSYILSQAQYCVKLENQGLHHFLENNQLDIIKEMHELFRQNQVANETFQEGVVKYILKKGSQILDEKKTNKKEESDVVLDQLIELYEQIERYQKNAFIGGSNSQIQSFLVAIRGAFEQVINQDLFVTVQLNKNLDLCFRKEFKSAQDQEADAKLQRNFQIFRLIKQKDVFENHYKKLLCKRLLEGTSLSEDFEKMFVNKMKMECGFGYTSKIETMFKDIETSKMEMIEFKKNTRQIAHSAQRPLLAAIDLEIQVLTLGHWPLQDPIQFNLSDELRFWKNSFEKYYKDRYKQRKLTWFSLLGFVDLRAHYKDRKKEFIASALQACILLQFNTSEKITIKELSEKLEIETEQIKREVTPLIQLQILLKQNQAEEYANNEYLYYNPNFNHRSYKLKVILQTNMQELFKKAKKEEETQSNEEDSVKQEVVLERKFVIESMIVRLMKARKQLDYKQLVDQVIGLAAQRHFVPDIQLIKQCLENLMWRDYISRSEDDQNIYIYKA